MLLFSSAFVMGFFLVSAMPISMQYAAEVTYPTPEGTSNSLIQLFGQAGGGFRLYNGGLENPGWFVHTFPFTGIWIDSIEFSFHLPNERCNLRGENPLMTNQQYAISEYHDTDEIYARLNALIKQPIRPIRRDKMEEYLGYFETKAAKSKVMTDEAKQYIPGGVQHNLAFNYPFPMAIEKAEGAYLWDIDGNQYIDFLQAGGPTVLGSNYAPVREKVQDVINTSGPVTGLFHEYRVETGQDHQQAHACGGDVPHVGIRY